MTVAFGKKSAAKAKDMYCVKKTASGRRVAKVVTKVSKTTGKARKVYNSSGAAVGASVVCYPTKAKATAALKKAAKTDTKLKGGRTVKRATTKRKVKSSAFGKKGVSPLPYGFVVCVDPENPGEYKPYKAFIIKWQGETFNIVRDKSVYGSVRVFAVPEDAKIHRVKTTGTKTEEKASAALARKKARRQADKYELLGSAGINLNLSECGAGHIQAIQGAGYSRKLLSGMTSEQVKALYNGETSRGARNNLTLNNISNSLAQRLGRGSGENGPMSSLVINRAMRGVDTMPYARRQDGKLLYENANKGLNTFNPYSGSVRNLRGPTSPSAQPLSFGRLNRNVSRFGHVNFGFNKPLAGFPESEKF